MQPFESASQRMATHFAAASFERVPRFAQSLSQIVASTLLARRKLLAAQRGLAVSMIGLAAEEDAQVDPDGDGASRLVARFLAAAG